MTQTPHALVEQDGGILVVTMNRPEARNAISPQMSQLLADAWQRANDDDAVRAVILTGAGGDFSAGADLKYLAGGEPADEVTKAARESTGIFDPRNLKMFLKGYRLNKPLIVAVEGYALAGGTELVIASDIRVAAQGAIFGLTEPKWSLFPMAGSAVRLPRQVPYTVAADWLMTGRQVRAEEAYRYGLIGHLVPDGEAMAKARELAGLIVRNGPVAVRNILRAMRASEALPEQQAFDIETLIGIETFASDDAKEGPLAFAEKRDPIFKDK
ncbi:enoyl-CoA hydratase [Jatrophihabitans sp. GAS493]|uniref:crotonase/enoyl-CoA hydratase family protein n=1 Tax=Jatrophihabitans sp. GAS493 TaxID=1907575 RepID=UPI000BB7AC84|nr:crotonase/enoyl-CoA hydratase family protein [Jatrophihabitans sp. GAS493]SOD74056.1 enoyl-CoA hydratase [Jatrophihabitans sp. GAS493]